MKQEVYDIGGMHCAACSSAVERVTRRLPGVVRSEVNLPMNRLTIEYDEALCSPDAIISKVEKAGFSASPHADEPRASANAASGAKKELRTLRVSLIVSVVFAAALLTLSMGHMMIADFPLPDLISPGTHPVNFALAQLLLCIPVLACQRQFFTRGFTALFHLNPNMDTLVALSASASLLYSLVMTFLISDDAHYVHSLYYESAAVVVALVAVGKYLEAGSQEKTKDAIAKLIALTPDTAVLVDENGQWEVPTAMIKPGDTVLVKPGARVPLDGVVKSGSGSADEAMLTGESMPVEKSEGSEVIGGSVSLSGALFVRVTRVGEDTTLAKMIRFVEDAQGKKAPISRTADRVAGVFVPAVMAVALIAAAAWLIAGEGFAFALRIFTSVLVIACPCAMGLATPTAIIVGTGIGAQHGILIRSGEALETTHRVTTVILDKTGTVTEGRPAVTDIISGDADALLRAVWPLERLSDHPLAKAICASAEKRGWALPPAATDFESVAGRGLAGTDAAGRRIYAGNAEFLAERGVDASAFAEDMARLQREGKTAVAVALDGEALGVLGIADTIKPDAAEAVAALREMGVRTILLTGDSRAAAEYIGAQAKVDEVVAGVLPTQKAEAVKAIQSRGGTVMMVGDGINDAPALVQADVGCAIGSGSDIAVDSADVVLMRPELMDVKRTLRLGRMTIRNIKQNLFWAFCYNTLCIPVAAGVLYPAFGLLLSPMLGAAAMSLSSIFVVTNALRMKGRKL